MKVLVAILGSLLLLAVAAFSQQFPDGLPPRGVWGSERSEEGLTRTMGLVRLALS